MTLLEKENEVAKIKVLISTLILERKKIELEIENQFNEWKSILNQPTDEG